jgi:chromatin segregation and condensation protein Rec8/ScpA/Scc1 (kleisin family)
MRRKWMPPSTTTNRDAPATTTSNPGVALAGQPTPLAIPEGQDEEEEDDDDDNNVDRLPECLEEVIAAMSKFKLQAEKLGLSEKNMIDVLKKERAGNVVEAILDKKNVRLPKSSALVKTMTPAQIQRQQNDDPRQHRSKDRVNTTIEIDQAVHGTASTISSLTLRGSAHKQDK